MIPPPSPYFPEDEPKPVYNWSDFYNTTHPNINDAYLMHCELFKSKDLKTLQTLYELHIRYTEGPALRNKKFGLYIEDKFIIQQDVELFLYQKFIAMVWGGDMPQVVKEGVMAQLKTIVGPYALTTINKGVDNSEISAAARKLPGVSVLVTLPCMHGGHGPSMLMTLFEAIIHLNDTCKWDRNRIADWIDDLHDKGIINAIFEVD